MASENSIVGIGASAGGVEALQALFGHMPLDSGMAFVVITHLARGRASSLVEILARSTSLPVLEAQDGAEVQSDHVYVIPPDGIVTIADHRLQVRQLDQQHLIRHPIDIFLASLAEHSSERAVAIILSGSGNDGTLGVKVIKERGGLTIAQGPDHAPPRYADMPNSAIASGLVDLVLSLEQIPEALIRYGRQVGGQNELGSQGQGRRAVNKHTVTARQAIHTILRERLGHDFSGYKDTTFLRRVQRRMQVRQAPDLDAYVERLRHEPDEASLLFRDLLIGVTNFFRDAAAFAALEQHVIPRLFEGKGPADQLRVWVPACSTGEEVYSIGILLRERADTIAKPPEIKILASDINQPALEVARAGHYPGALLEAVSPERLSRFFDENAGLYTIARPVREMCVFSAHSLVRDPPFSRIDLISCRNLLIYLTADKQDALVPIFHYALRPSGYLFLGEAENVSQHADLFTALDKKHRIFQRQDHVTPSARLSAFVPIPRRAPADGGEAQRASAANDTVVRRATESWVLERFAPAHVVVDGAGDVVHYSARTGNYLEAPPGQPSRHLLSLARKGLRLDLRAALQEAMDTRRLVTRERLPLQVGRDIQLVDIAIEPLPHRADEPLYLVLFRDVGPPLSPEQVATNAAQRESDPSVERLERELRDTRERLQAILEEHETGVEELKSSNEELVSLNEELQSTNEELETNKEELQSTNEELNTVNSELNRNLDQLSQANSDLQNLFDSTQIALIFLDQELRIRSFTSPAASLFSLIRSDCGRPLADITHRLNHGELDGDLRAALTAGTTIERRIARRDGEGHYLMRVLPYRGAEGVIVTLVNIDLLVDAERSQKAAIARLDTRLRQQAAIAEFGAEALRTTDLDALLQQASILVAKGLEIERAKVLELAPEKDHLLVRAGIGWDPGVVGKATIGADRQSPAGHALLTGEPVVSVDFALEHRFRIPALLQEHNIRSAINVIIRGEGEPFGVLEVDSTKVRQFDEDDIHFMQSCANLVASALDRLKAQTRLERALEERKVLLHELQHRVKNNLQEMSALVGLERRKIADPVARRPLEVLASRLEALSVVYRQLYMVNHHTEVPLDGYLAELAGELFAFHGVDSAEIASELRLAEMRVDIDSALPLGLITCEFIVNSFKHAFPQGRGCISLRLEQDGPGRARLTLADDGVGLQPQGTHPTGSGLQLIRRLVEQIGGELQVAGEGSTTMTIAFPLRLSEASSRG